MNQKGEVSDVWATINSLVFSPLTQDDGTEYLFLCFCTISKLKG